MWWFLAAVAFVLVLAPWSGGRGVARWAATWRGTRAARTTTVT